MMTTIMTMMTMIMTMVNGDGENDDGVNYVGNIDGYFFQSN